jgi:UDP-N-acetylglucosamine 2-epimerase (non-hydrolysing)
MRIVIVAGARPNFMKVAPILRVLESAGIASVLVHSGQHYDVRMSDTFFTDLDIRSPDYNLEVGSGTHAVQTAHVMEAFEPVLLAERPDWLVVVGDVNSTLACALVAAKLRVETGTRVAHVEAGLRSHDWSMPEEINRILTDRISDLLLTPSRDARANLVSEGIDESRIRFVGNVMIDTLRHQLPLAKQLDFASELGILDSSYALATIHRPSNVDDPAALRTILEALGAIALRMPVLLPLHPRTGKNIEKFGLTDGLQNVRVLEPLGYRQMLSLTAGAAAVLTDSGGLQEETTALGVPCVTLREQTERPVTITEGSNRLSPWPLSRDGVVRSFDKALEQRRSGDAVRIPEGWDGRAAERVVAALTAG